MLGLHLSWEFPPRIIGGISAHLFDLSRALIRRGISVHVVTCNFPGAPDYETIDGVYVHRFEAYAAGDSFIGWILRMQKSMERKVGELVNSIGPFDFIHAHDWVSGVAGVGLKHLFRKPLIVTMHSTEYGRRAGLHNDFQRSIHEIENWLCYEAWRVITCSHYMRDHVAWCFSQPQDKIDTIPNGVDVTKWSFPFDHWEIRSRFVSKGENLILFVGRMVIEKGLDTIILALPILLRHGIPVKLVAVGEGPQRETCQRLAKDMGLSEKVHFAGHIDDWRLRALYRVADVAVFPSRFEPFGIVALEAMAAQCPLVVSAVGGLNEIVDHGVNGLKVSQDNPEALAMAVERILEDSGLRNRMVKNAYEKCLQVYNWDRIAEQTLHVYERVLKEWEAGVWKPI